jgi:hypothetical protein
MHTCTHSGQRCVCVRTHTHIGLLFEKNMTCSQEISTWKREFDMIVRETADLRVMKVRVEHNNGEGENVHRVGSVEYLVRRGRLHIHTVPLTSEYMQGYYYYYYYTHTNTHEDTRCAQMSEYMQRHNPGIVSLMPCGMQPSVPCRHVSHSILAYTQPSQRLNCQRPVSHQIWQL